MNLRAVGRMLGVVLLLMAGFLVVPCVVALAQGDMESTFAFLASAAVSVAVGGVLAWRMRGSTSTASGRPDFFRREGLAVVGLAWLVGGAVGALPYLFSGVLSSFVDAFFESVSGFTTTGSTVLSGQGIASMPDAVAFWRSFTHWLGGFGIVMVFVVLFPTGGRSLFRSEIPGVWREAGHQRVRDSALTLLRIYVGISAIEFVLLIVAGMSAFDAALHTFGTIATGGFSNHPESVAYFQSVPIELILTLFMFACGVNFSLYDTLLRSGPGRFVEALRSSLEVKAYALIAGGSAVLIGIVLWFWGGSNGDPTSTLPDYREFWQAMRDSLFLCVSLQTTTGFGTADYDQWPELCRMLLMVLAVIGTCAGSTGGGIKVVRILIVSKAAINGVRRFVRPRAIETIRMDGQTLDPGTVASVTGYIVLWMLVFLGGTLVLTGQGVAIESAATAVIATLNNIGPGLSLVGPTQNFELLPDFSKLLLTLFMILGRLEFYAVVALLVPGFWRH
jgi:trk system potassium uptake protein TrkH